MQDLATDTELVLAAQGGDAGGLAVLLERHRAGMLAVALRILGYSPEAEDVVQDAVLVALRRIDELRDPAAVGPWLHAIVRNACRMRLRVSHSDPLAIPALGLPSAEPSPEEVLDRQALRDWVWHALGDLSEPLRLVVMLRYFSGVSSYGQIAALCGVPVGTVRSRLNQAKRKLAGALLASAGQAHDGASSLAVARCQEFADLLTAAERGTLPAALAGRWSPDSEIVAPDGRRTRGLDFLIYAMDSDLTAGVHQRPANVVASRDLTIVEAELLSPSDDPDHCPRGVVWLSTLRDGRVRRLRLFHPQPSPTAAETGPR
jgi:RNA polymerase sigma-70 factor (ECF subfamily)